MKGSDESPHSSFAKKVVATSIGLMFIAPGALLHTVKKSPGELIEENALAVLRKLNEGITEIAPENEVVLLARQPEVDDFGYRVRN